MNQDGTPNIPVDPSKLLNTDPRTEIVMWTVVVSPLVYGVARTGFTFSKGTSFAFALTAGALIWAGIPKAVANAYGALMSITDQFVPIDNAQNRAPVQ